VLHIILYGVGDCQPIPGELEKLLAAMKRQATNDIRPLKNTPRLVAKGKKMPRKQEYDSTL